MEGAEAIQSFDELPEWWQLGLRIIGPAWAGTRFCGGSGEPGPLTSEGYALLDAMAECGFVLDISHMDERAVLQALDHYPGAVIASHSNALALLKGSDSNRHLSDVVIRVLLERGGVIGIVPLGNFLLPGWKAGDSRQEIGLKRVVAHIDYVCQMAGNALQVGLGTDFDGGFGVQSAPFEIDSSADLQKIGPLLAEKGYSDTDIAAILGENWISLLRRILPD
jgi:membrane dipeptidase